MTPTLPSHLQPAVAKVNRLTPAQVQEWLAAVLQGTQILLAGTPDEEACDSLLELEPFLDDTPRRYLTAGVEKLVREVMSGNAEIQPILPSLLHLVTALRIDSIGWQLAAWIQSPSSHFTSLPPDHQCHVLSAILQLRCRQSKEFWLARFAQNAALYGAVVFTALADIDLADAIRTLLGQIPNDIALAEKIAQIILPTCLEEALPAKRAAAISELQNNLSCYTPALRHEVGQLLSNMVSVSPAPFLANLDNIISQLTHKPFINIRKEAGIATALANAA